MERPYFPMFVDISGKKILVIGGGNIALRRVRTLLKFGADVQVISPLLKEELAELKRQEKITVEQRYYAAGDVQGFDIVLAASDSPAVNHGVWKECRKAGIPVNVADSRELCDFYFPSVVMTEEVVIGINSGGSDPGKVKKTRRKIEGMIEGL